LVELVAEFGFALTAFDMLGCGNSDSGMLTYGVNEVFDIRDMLEEVRKHTTVGRVTIWGRSMGSLCALMFANTYAYEVSALILDSPFRSLREVVQRIAEKKVQVPSWLLRPLLYFVEQRAS
jgi:pimeloyl-ACP methyl ester carboxylesterase